MSAQAGSSEVSKKLKLQAAIRAKLEELGVYVDDELPDYIMVMIANKKEKTQMKDDLSLFIGKSTAKFVDWLFDLFDRLQNASSKPGEGSSKKEDDKKKEADAKEQEEKLRKEKEDKDRELQKEKEREKEREREKDRQRERDREKRIEEEKRRDEKRKEIQRNKRRRSRSNTYSDEEDRVRQRKESDRGRDRRDHRGRSAERKRVVSTVIRQPSASPERQKVHSTVVVKRNIRPTGDSSTNVKGRGSMFLKALNEASVSAGYGPSKARDEKQEAAEEDDMSDVDALPSKTSKSPKKSIRERLSRANQAPVEDDDAVVLHNQQPTGGPQMILKLSGGKEAIKRARIQDRIVIDDSLRRGLLKRKVETSSGEPKSKHERIVFDIQASRDSTPTDDSPTMRKWDGQIQLDDDSESDDEEAEIDALVAEARGIARHDSVREEEEELRPTHQLSGNSFALHIGQAYQQTVPTYIPTPLSVLQEQQNQQMAPAKEDHHVKERCIFWPKCTKGDACTFMHPSKNCTNFPNCSYGIRCLFIHPPCRFDRFCTKKHCPFTHHGTGGVQTAPHPEISNPLTSNKIPVASAPVKTFDELPKPATRGALGSLAEKLAASLKKKTSEKTSEKPEEKAEEKTDENVKNSSPEAKKESPEKEGSVAAKPVVKTAPEVAPLQSMIPCRFAARCRNPVCHFKHPKECRFGANCRNGSCYFYHKPNTPLATVAPAAGDASAAKYKWTAST